MKLSRNARLVLETRYLRRGSDGKLLESIDDMYDRVADSVARAEETWGEKPGKWAGRFRTLMTEGRFLPNSPTLMNAGGDLGQLAACFVLPVEDSLKSIFNTLRDAALIHQSGGGTGFSFSKLRPRGDIVRTTGGVASGPVSFLRIYNSATEVVKQGGRRRGANMAVLAMDHPDIREFMELKRTPGELEHFNISAAISDKFMNALKEGRDVPLINPATGRETGRVAARQLFDELAEAAWQTGDPGVLFLDNINRTNPTPNLGMLESTNPCGEQPLLAYEACVLGSLNLSAYLEKDSAEIDYDALGRDIKLSVRFLDDAVEANVYPLPEIRQRHRETRKIGLGIMGWADLLIARGIPYQSEEALVLAETIMEFIKKESHTASADLAERRGPFPAWKNSALKEKEARPLRNATVTTIAPTGTLSIIADCSAGIEPIYALDYRRRVLDTEIHEYNEAFESLARKLGLYSEELKAEVQKQGSLENIKGIPGELKELFRTAHEIPAEWHLRMQAAFQKHTDNAVSKTVNLPPEATAREVAELYRRAWQLGLKGVTIFRSSPERSGTLIKWTEEPDNPPPSKVIYS